MGNNASVEELAFGRSKDSLSIVTGEKIGYWSIDARRLVLGGRIMRKFPSVCFNLFVN